MKVKIVRLIEIEGLFGEADSRLPGKLLHLYVEIIKWLLRANVAR